MLSHAEKVGRVSGQLRERKSLAPVTLKKKGVSHQMPKPFDKKYSDEKLDISDFDDILSIDPAERICLAEPGVSFSDLVAATLKHGLVPMTVPEHKGITIGGAVAGGSLESMSYKYGGFHDSCLEYEVVTAKGDVLTCTPEKDSLIFQMLHSTFGTLGILTRLKFRLIPAQKYVKIVYEKYDSIESYKAGILSHYEKHDIDFMDGMIFSQNNCVLSTGYFTDKAPFSHSYEWTRAYFPTVQKGKVDYIETADYFFRYDNGNTDVFPKSFLGRLLLGKFLGSSTTLKLAEKLRKVMPLPVTADLFIPFSKLTDFMHWYGKNVDFFPLWCVPYRLGRKYEWMSEQFIKRSPDELFIDLAIYGMRRYDKNYYRLIEEELIRIGGIKALISSNYFTEDEFWTIWNRDNYFKVKQQTDPDNILRDLYEKTCVAAMGLGR